MVALFVVIGVMLFLGSAAVIATAFAFLVTNGRLERREWRLFVNASAILAGLGVAYSQLED